MFIFYGQYFAFLSYLPSQLFEFYKSPSYMKIEEEHLIEEDLLGCSSNFDFQQILLGHIFVHDCTKNHYVVISCPKSRMVHSIPKIQYLLGSVMR